MPVRIGSTVKLYTILLLSEKPKYGYELMIELQKKLGTKISASQTYPFLNLLKKNKLIRIEETGIRAKKIYALTAEGKKFTGGILERFGDLLELAIEPRLSACAHCGCRVYEGGHREKIGKRVLVFCCKYCAKSFRGKR